MEEPTLIYKVILQIHWYIEDVLLGGIVCTVVLCLIFSIVYKCSLKVAVILAPVLCTTCRALDNPLGGGADDSLR